MVSLKDKISNITSRISLPNMNCLKCFIREDGNLILKFRPFSRHKPNLEDQLPVGSLDIKIHQYTHIKYPVDTRLDPYLLFSLAGCGEEAELLKGIYNGAPITECIPTFVRGFHKRPLIYLRVEREDNDDKERPKIIKPLGGSVSQSDFGDVPVSFNIKRGQAQETVDLTIHVYARVQKTLTIEEDLKIGTATLKLEIPTHSESFMMDRISTTVYNEVIKSAVGHIELSACYGRYPNLGDFDILRVVGTGAFGRVSKVRHKTTGEISALKSIKKIHVSQHPKSITHAIAERAALSQFDHPFIVSLKFAFQTETHLYLGLEFLNGGELFHHLRSASFFPFSVIKQYACEVLLALEYIHKNKVIYRDLKPENVLIAPDGHVKLCDFGLCKLGVSLNTVTHTRCGTSEYLAPELISPGPYSLPVDFWAFEVLLFEMTFGHPPWYDPNEAITRANILKSALEIPDHRKIPRDLRSLIVSLLRKNPDKRLGSTSGTKEIKRHEYFQDIDWKKVYRKEYDPAWSPTHDEEESLYEEFAGERFGDGIGTERKLTEQEQQNFEGWSYNAPTDFF